MTRFKSAALFTALGFLLASLASSPKAAPDGTLGMALLSASVNNSGNLTRSIGAVSAEKVSAHGQYKVVFNRVVYLGCTYTATINGAGPSGEVGFIVADGSSSDFVLVRTYNAAGNFEDRPFSLTVFCAGG